MHLPQPPEISRQMVKNSGLQLKRKCFFEDRGLTKRSRYEDNVKKVKNHLHITIEIPDDKNHGRELKYQAHAFDTRHIYLASNIYNDIRLSQWIQTFKLQSNGCKSTISKLFLSNTNMDRNIISDFPKNANFHPRTASNARNAEEFCKHTLPVIQMSYANIKPTFTAKLSIISSSNADNMQVHFHSPKEQMNYREVLNFLYFSTAFFNRDIARELKIIFSRPELKFWGKSCIATDSIHVGMIIYDKEKMAQQNIANAKINESGNVKFNTSLLAAIAKVPNNRLKQIVLHCGSASEIEIRVGQSDAIMKSMLKAEQDTLVHEAFSITIDCDEPNSLAETLKRLEYFIDVLLNNLEESKAFSSHNYSWTQCLQPKEQFRGFNVAKLYCGENKRIDYFFRSTAILKISSRMPSQAKCFTIQSHWVLNENRHELFSNGAICNVTPRLFKYDTLSIPIGELSFLMWLQRGSFLSRYMVINAYSIQNLKKAAVIPPNNVGSHNSILQISSEGNASSEPITNTYKIIPESGCLVWKNERLTLTQIVDSLISSKKEFNFQLPKLEEAVNSVLTECDFFGSSIKLCMQRDRIDNYTYFEKDSVIMSQALTLRGCPVLHESRQRILVSFGAMTQHYTQTTGGNDEMNSHFTEYSATREGMLDVEQPRSAFRCQALTDAQFKDDNRNLEETMNHTKMSIWNDRVLFSKLTPEDQLILTTHSISTEYVSQKDNNILTVTDDDEMEIDSAVPVLAKDEPLCTSRDIDINLIETDGVHACLCHCANHRCIDRDDPCNQEIYNGNDFVTAIIPDTHKEKMETSLPKDGESKNGLNQGRTEGHCGTSQETPEDIPQELVVQLIEPEVNAQRLNALYTDKVHQQYTILSSSSQCIEETSLKSMKSMSETTEHSIAVESVTVDVTDVSMTDPDGFTQFLNEDASKNRNHISDDHQIGSKGHQPDSNFAEKCTSVEYSDKGPSTGDVYVEFEVAKETGLGKNGGNPQYDGRMYNAMGVDVTPSIRSDLQKQTTSKLWLDNVHLKTKNVNLVESHQCSKGGKRVPNKKQMTGDGKTHGGGLNTTSPSLKTTFSSVSINSKPVKRKSLGIRAGLSCSYLPWQETFGNLVDHRDGILDDKHSDSLGKSSFNVDETHKNYDAFDDVEYMDHSPTLVDQMVPGANLSSSNGIQCINSSQTYNEACSLDTIQKNFKMVRTGLSRKQRVTSLHPYLKVMKKRITTEGYYNGR